MEDAHRLFLQSIMCKGLLDGTQVRQLYREVCLKTGKPYQREHQKENIGAFVMTINTALKPMEQRIEKVFDEMSGKQYFCFINLDDNELTRLLIPYSKPELELFKKMVEEILMTEDGLITTTAVLNLVRNIELRLSMKDAEEFLGKLKESRWIEIEDGQVALSIRAIHELEHYIRRQFADFAVLCNICKRLVVRGQCCSSCDVKIHNYCASKYFKEKKEMMCPKKNCKTPWPDYDNDTDAVLNRSFDAMEPSPRKRPR